MPRRALPLLLTLLLALAACGQPSASAPATEVIAVPPPTVAATPVPTAAPTAATVAPTAAPTAAATVAPGGTAVELTDAAGRAVTIAAPPARIISLAPSTTEILFALGLGPRVVAVDDLSNFPPEAAALPKIGSYGTVNYEQIAALTPDLVLAAGITAPEQIQKIADLGLTVLVVGQAESSVASVYDDIALAGRATGTADVAKRVSDDLRDRIGKLTERLAGQEPPTVFWELDATDPTKPFSVGPGSFVDELITLAGGKNIIATGSNPYPQISSEQVVAADPQAIIMADSPYGMTAEQVAARPGWEGIAAVKAGAVYPIDADLVSRPGPRLAEGLEAIARLLHPDLFK